MNPLVILGLLLYYGLSHRRREAQRHARERSPRRPAPPPPPGPGPLPQVLEQARQAFESLRRGPARDARAKPAAAAPASPPPEPFPETENALALLLIEAMIAAAYADRRLDETELADILARADEAGLGTRERSYLAGKLVSPPSLESLVARVRTREVAEQVYQASCLAIQVDSEAEMAYLGELGLRLRLDQGTRSRIEREAETNRGGAGPVPGPAPRADSGG